MTTPRRSARARGSVAALAAVGAAVAVGLALTGCTAVESPAPASSASPHPSAPSPSSTPAAPVVVDGLGLAVLQNRPDYATRVLQLSVTNETTTPITVVGARFESPQFAAPADYTKTTSVEVPAGLTRQLPVPLPAAVCPLPAGATPSVTITVTDASGARREVTGEPADPFGVLPRIAGEDCVDEAVAAVATLRLDDDLEVTGSGGDSVAHLRLHVEPTGGTGTLDLDEVRFTILLQPVQGTTWPLDATVSGGDPPREFVLDAVPARCDPHAIAEDKRGTVLPVVVGVAGGPSGTVSVSPSAALRLALYDFIAAHCGFATAP